MRVRSLKCDFSGMLHNNISMEDSAKLAFRVSNSASTFCDAVSASACQAGRDPWLSAAASHSRSFDHRRRARAPLTAIANAFRCPTSTTSRLPRVTPV